MVGTPTMYTGEDATVTIHASGNSTDYSHTTLAISDFTLTLSKGTAEQELVGEQGNYFLGGSLSAEGSLTACKLHNLAIGNLVRDMIVGTSIQVSGSCGPNSLHFYLRSCQITGFDFSIGSADDISEGSIDFTSLYPYKISVQRLELGYTYINDTY